jgi:hypothetical protein
MPIDTSLAMSLAVMSAMTLSACALRRLEPKAKSRSLEMLTLGGGGGWFGSFGAAWEMGVTEAHQPPSVRVQGAVAVVGLGVGPQAMTVDMITVVTTPARYREVLVIGLSSSVAGSG